MNAASKEEVMMVVEDKENPLVEITEVEIMVVEEEEDFNLIRCL